MSLAIPTVTVNLVIANLLSRISLGDGRHQMQLVDGENLLRPLAQNCGVVFLRDTTLIEI